MSARAKAWVGASALMTVNRCSQQRTLAVAPFMVAIEVAMAARHAGRYCPPVQPFRAQS